MGQFKHGHTRRVPGGRVNSPEWRSYQAMRTRCTNPNAPRFGDYGGRGIKVCERWLRGEGGKSGFECFLADVGPKPGSDFTLDRRKNERGYEPGNVRWATRVQQARNTRATVFVDLCGVEVPLAQAIERWGAAPPTTVRMRRFRGWSNEDAILTPAGMPRGSYGFPLCI